MEGCGHPLGLVEAAKWYNSGNEEAEERTLKEMHCFSVSRALTALARPRVRLTRPVTSRYPVRAQNLAALAAGQGVRAENTLGNAETVGLPATVIQGREAKPHNPQDMDGLGQDPPTLASSEHGNPATRETACTSGDGDHDGTPYSRGSLDERDSMSSSEENKPVWDLDEDPPR
ncbi:hypothetical protein C0995_013963 [Termitomyces sp. Mi166|nr:hypothetical protein C0995_013963 [Termitomyces sp. Mi166\